jgi:hypothetical protein
MIASPVSLVLSRLEPFNLRANGRDRWRACCPAHGGSNPSALSIGEATNGAVLLRCWQGCNVESIAAALGLEVSDLFPPRQSAWGGASAPARRRMLTAGQALELLDAEATLVVVCASDMARGEVLQEETRDRLRLGAARIALMRGEAAA